MDCPLLYGYGPICWANHRVLWRQMENRVRFQGNQAGHWQQQNPSPQCTRCDQPHKLFHDGSRYYLDLWHTLENTPNVATKSRGETVSPSQIWDISSPRPHWLMILMSFATKSRNSPENLSWTHSYGWSCDQTMQNFSETSVNKYLIAKKTGSSILCFRFLASQW